MTEAAYKVVQVKRPVSGKVIGYRMVMAHINNAQYDLTSGEMVQSFHPRYRITESGDMRMEEITEQKQREFIERAIKWHRFDRVRIYG